MSWRDIEVAKARLSSESTMKRIILRLERDWIHFAYDETKNRATIFIESSYGCWSNSWSAMGTNTTLPEFFLEADKDYLSNKFWVNTHSNDSKKYFCGKIAIVELRNQILKQRRNGSISKNNARKYYNVILDGYLEEQGNSPDLWREEYYNLGLGDFDPDFFEGNPGMLYKTSFFSLRDLIIPAIKRYFNGELKKNLAKDVKIV